MSASLNWMIVRNQHSYLVKKRNVKKPFSSEPFNLKNVHSFRYNGFVNEKAVDIKPDASGKGVVFTYKLPKNANRPKRTTIERAVKGGPRRGLVSLRKFFKSQPYRTDLLMMTLRRASAFYRSQKTYPFKSKRRMRKIGRMGRTPKAGAKGSSSKKSE